MNASFVNIIELPPQLLELPTLDVPLYFLWDKRAWPEKLGRGLIEDRPPARLPAQLKFEFRVTKESSPLTSTKLHI